MNRLFKLSTLSLIILSSVSCGGGNSSDNSAVNNNELVVTQTVGDIDIAVSGLPDGIAADILLTGPNNYSNTLTAGETLSSLPTGQYQITVNTVSSQGVNYSFSTGSQTINVTANQTTTLVIDYKAPTTSTGIITGFGSIYINGVKFETGQASVTAGGAAVDESALEVGMVITVKGNIGANGEGATATEVSYQASAQGPVSTINLAEQSFVLLGQTYFIDEFTEFEGIEFDAIQVGSWLEVSAIENSEDNYVASRIELVSDSQTLSLVGTVSQLNTEAMTFKIGEQLVDYSEAELDGELVDSVDVKVESDQALVDGTLVASRVEVEEEDDLSGQIIKLQGEIEVFNSITDFVIDGQAITTNDETQFEGGAAEDLAVGVLISVSGVVVDDVLLADEIRIEMPAEIIIEGLVDAIDLEAGSVEILSNTIITNEFTQFIDVSEEKVRRFRLDDVSIGDKITVKAFIQGDALVARQFKRRKAEVDVDDNSEITKLEGKASNISASSFTLQGILVSVTEATEIEFPNGSELTLSEFFTKLTTNNRVEVAGVAQSDGSVLALSIELKAGQNDLGAGNSIRFEGTVDSFDSIEKFTVNGHDITTNNQTRYKDGSAELLEVGVEVEIKGRQADDGTILATKIDFEQTDEDEREVEIEGLVSGFVDASNFNVGNQIVSTSENTEFKNGTADSLSDGVYVEVKGEVNNDGVLTAEKVTFEKPDEVEIEGVVTEFISESEFSISDQAIITNEVTEYKNGSAAMLALGVNLEVKGTLSENGVLLASKIEFEEPEEAEVKGAISVFTSANDFEIDGTRIITDEFTQFKNGTPEQLELGVMLEVEGYINQDGSLLAVKVEFEDIDDDETQIELEGIISVFTDVTDFKIGDQAITTDEFTEFKNGTAENLALDVKVEVKGELNADQVLVAAKVEFVELDQESEQTEVSGKISNFVSAREFNVSDKVVMTTGSTDFIDGTSDDLANDVDVTVVGKLNGAGKLIAEKVTFN